MSATPVIIPRWRAGRAVHAGLVAILLADSGAVVGTQPASGRRIWRGVRTETAVGASCRARNHEEFEFIEEVQPDGGQRWISRRVRWNNHGSCEKESVLGLTADGRRIGMPWSIECENSGEADLNTWDHRRSRPRCQQRFPGVEVFGNVMPNIHSAPTSNSGPVSEDMLRDGCSFTRYRRWVDTIGSLHVMTQVITLTYGDPLRAVMEVSRRDDEPYAGFVPAPGATITFRASTTSGPGRFRFELVPEETSRFPGYTTNARVDQTFFEKHGLTHLRSQYADDGPDLMFDPVHFDASDWSRREPLVVETRNATAEAAVTVRAMDYGAVGRLRAFVKPEGDCGAWEPVTVRIEGETRDFVAIPLDDDGNLIADALDEYRLLDSGSDLDGEPKGNGTAGDGLTAFEEYRGFVVNTACPDASQNRHLRTSPDRKDLFVHTLDPEFAQILPRFGWSSGLSVHVICEPQYVDNDTRIVNFTLQAAGLRTWQAHTLSQKYPQHGIHLQNRTMPDDWPHAITCSDRSCIDDTAIGPPALTYAIWVNKTGILGAELPDPTTKLVHSVMHELGHAVGIPHHPDTVAGWRIQGGRHDIVGPLIIAPGGDCRDPAEGGNPALLAAYLDETFQGCVFSNIVRQGGQRSGDAWCPMRYSFGTFHEAPGSDTRPLDTVRVNRSSDGAAGPPTPFDRWTGRFFLYDNEADFPSTGRLCQSKTGTDLNDADRGEDNHAGNAPRACVDYLIVNDTVLGGERER